MANARLVYSLIWLALPIAVAAFDLTLATAVVLVLLALLGRWLVVLVDLVAPAATPEVVLESIGASHFVEKVRWCLDRLGVDYAEERWAGTLGAFYRGRTVPRLEFRTGRVRSSIGNSAEILRYLYGRYRAQCGPSAEFLAPMPERLELERELDRYGVSLQVWVYWHLLPRRDLTLTVWGVRDEAVPWWQRQLVRILYPLQAVLIRRSFRLDTEHFAKAVERIEHLLADIDTRLADGRAAILGETEPSYVDFTFAALSTVWLSPENRAAGRAEQVRLEPDRLPGAMRADVRRWMEDYPKATAHVLTLYRDERMALCAPLPPGVT